jgi:hypothetical protein
MDELTKKAWELYLRETDGYRYQFKCWEDLPKSLKDYCIQAVQFEEKHKPTK